MYMTCHVLLKNVFKKESKHKNVLQMDTKM